VSWKAAPSLRARLPTARRSSERNYFATAPAAKSPRRAPRLARSRRKDRLSDDTSSIRIGESWPAQAGGHAPRCQVYREQQNTRRAAGRIRSQQALEQISIPLPNRGCGSASERTCSNREKRLIFVYGNGAQRLMNLFRSVNRADGQGERAYTIFPVCLERNPISSWARKNRDELQPDTAASSVLESEDQRRHLLSKIILPVDRSATPRDL